MTMARKVATLIYGDPMGQALAELAAAIDGTLPSDGEIETLVPHLHFGRSSALTRPVHAAQWPCLTLVAQGKKTISFAGDTISYGPGDFVIVALDMPTASRVVRASTTEPYLGLAIALDPIRLHSVLQRTCMPLPQSVGVRAVVGVGRLTDPLLDAVLRLVRLIDTPTDVSAIAPLIEEEILYRLLTSDQGWRLLQMARKDSPGNRIAKAVACLKRHFRRNLRVEELAAFAGMSESSLHQHFRAITGLTPIQYQKQLRLMEARRLITVDGHDISSASLHVGYQSPSQFSRDYKRQYGSSPRADIRRGDDPGDQAVNLTDVVR